MPASLRIDAGEKYALIALRTNSPPLPDPIALGQGLWAWDRIPLAFDDNWRRWIGSVRERAIRQTNLVLVAKMPSSQIDTRDGENQMLKERVLRLFWSLLLTAAIRVYDSAFLISGSHREGRAEVWQFSEPSVPLAVSGSPMDLATPAMLRTATAFLEAIGELDAIGGFKRVGRVYAIYQRALQTPDHVERLHQFCRCLEGFILPDIAQTTSQFRSRTELFVGPRHHDLMGRLYQMRSRAEHLHDVFDAPTSDERERRLGLLRDSVFVEELSRRCIARFLATRELWQHFANDDALRQFWRPEAAEMRRAIWGDPFDVDDLRGRFDEQQVSDGHLGLAR
jgi:hypothetical protein